MATAYTDQVQKVYIAYYGRAADPVGLAYWAGKVETEGLAGIMASFGASAEATTLYGNLTSEGMVNALYLQTFGRAPDIDGLLYYAGELANARMTPASIAQNIFDGASGTDATILANKLVVAKAYTAAIDTAAEVVAYSGTVAAASARTLLSTVDAATVTASFDVATTIASVVTASNSTSNAGTTYVLTDTANTSTGGADNFIGGAGDDTFLAQAAASLSNGDVVDGGAGTDSLTARYSVTAASTINTSITNVEKIYIDLDDGDITANHNTTINTSGFTGLTDVISKNADSTTAQEDVLIFSNMAAGVNAGITNGDAFSSTTFTYKTTTAVTDTATLNLNAGVADTVTMAGIETITINAVSGTSAIDTLTTTAATKLILAGSGKLTLTNVDDATTTIDASAATGNVTIAGVGAVTSVITGGSGDDSVDMAGTLTTADTVDLGAGSDTVKMSGLGASTTLSTLGISNVETIQVIGTAGTAATVVTDGQVGLETLVFVENATTSIDQTATDLAAGVKVQLNIKDTLDMGVVNLGLKDASGTDDVLDVSVKLTTAFGSETIENISFTNIETLNLTSTALTAVDTVLATDINVVSAITGDAKLTKLTVSGETSATLSTTAAATALATIDASAFTGNLTFTVAATADNAITGGSGDDTIIMAATMTNADSVDGGTHGSLTTSGDTLTATVTSLTATTGALNISNVEQVDLIQVGTGVIDATAITGADVIGFSGEAATKTTITNIPLGTNVGIGTKTKVSDLAGTLVMSLADETGTDDSLTINAYEPDATATVTLQATAIENITIALSTTDTTVGTAGAVNFTTSGLNASKLTLTGSDADTNSTATLQTLDTETVSLVATAFKGILTVTGSASATTFDLSGANNHDVTGGSSKDTVNVASNGTTAVAYNLDGGATGSTTSTLNLTLGGGTLTDTAVEDFKTINYTIDASAVAEVIEVTAMGINDSDTTTVTIGGGNTLSTFEVGSTLSIGNFGGSESTGLTSIDASGFNGSATLAFGTSVLDTALTLTGSGNSDAVTALYDHASQDEVLKVSNVKTLNILTDLGGGSGDDNTFNLAAVTGVTTFGVHAGVAALDNNTVQLTNVPAGMAIALGSSTGVEISNGITHNSLYGSSTVAITLASNTGTADALTVNVVDTDTTTDTTTLTGAGVEVLTLDIGTVASQTHKLSLTGVAATALSNQTINIVDGIAAVGLTIVDVDSTNNVIDASSFLGDLTISDRETTATTITTAAGADSVPHLHESDVIDLGTGADTLTVTYQAIGKAIDVDMSVAAGVDMITVGGAAGTSQANFENVTLTGFVGTGSNVTGSTGVNTIIGSPYVDAINPGLGADIITGGSGVDYINVTETTASRDIVVLGDSIDGSNYDQITGWTTASDDIRALASVHAWNSTANAATLALGTGADLELAEAAGLGDNTVLTLSGNVSTNTYVTYMAGTSTYAQLETATIAAMSDSDGLDAAAIVLVAIDDGTHTGLWQVTSADAGTDNGNLVASEVELIGIIKAHADATTLVVGDFLFT